MSEASWSSLGGLEVSQMRLGSILKISISFVMFFAVSLVAAMNKVDEVALATVFVCTSVRLDGLLVGQAADWMDFRSNGGLV